MFAHLQPDTFLWQAHRRSEHVGAHNPQVHRRNIVGHRRRTVAAASRRDARADQRRRRAHRFRTC